MVGRLRAGMVKGSTGGAILSLAHCVKRGEGRAYDALLNLPACFTRILCAGWPSVGALDKAPQEFSALRRFEVEQKRPLAVVDKGIEDPGHPGLIERRDKPNIVRAALLGLRVTGR